MWKWIECVLHIMNGTVCGWNFRNCKNRIQCAQQWVQPLNLFDLKLWGTKNNNSRIHTAKRALWVPIQTERGHWTTAKIQNIDMSIAIAISNGQTEATIMRINEFTQVNAWRKREKKSVEHKIRLQTTQC